MFTKLYGIQLSYRPNIMLLIGLNFIPYVKLFLCISSAVGRIIYLLIPLAPMCCMLWYSLTNINLIFYTMDCVYVKIVFVLLNIMFFFHIVVELVVLIDVVDFFVPWSVIFIVKLLSISQNNGSILKICMVSKLVYTRL